MNSKTKTDLPMTMMQLALFSNQKQNRQRTKYKLDELRQSNSKRITSNSNIKNMELFEGTTEVTTNTSSLLESIEEIYTPVVLAYLHLLSQNTMNDYQAEQLDKILSLSEEDSILTFLLSQADSIMCEEDNIDLEESTQNVDFCSECEKQARKIIGSEEYDAWLTRIFT
jgi:hypothetical protein